MALPGTLVCVQNSGLRQILLISLSRWKTNPEKYCKALSVSGAQEAPVSIFLLFWMFPESQSFHIGRPQCLHDLTSVQ